MAHTIAKSFSSAPLAKNGVIATLKVWFAVYQQRQRLKSMDTDRLLDMGLDHHAVSAELKRPFWDVPQHWLC